MNRSRIAEILFGIFDERIPREQRIETIKKAVRDGTYITEERLQAAFEVMLQEIQAG